MTLVERVVEAHGGLERWHRAAAIRLRLSSGGLAFASKGCRTALHDVTATVATTGQEVCLETPGWTHCFDDAIPHPRGVRWSSGDIAAFAATALWIYVALPFLLPQLDVEERGDRLVVRFPPGLRTHSPTQVLHVDGDGLIRRHDYTALDFGPWARATQEVGAYREAGALRFATRRRVRPRMWPHRPLLVWIDIASVEVQAVQPMSADGGQRVRPVRPSTSSSYSPKTSNSSSTPGQSPTEMSGTEHT